MAEKTVVTADDVRAVWTRRRARIDRGDDFAPVAGSDLAALVSTDMVDADGEPLPELFQMLADRLNTQAPRQHGANRQKAALEQLRTAEREAVQAAAVADQAWQDKADAVRGCFDAKVPVQVIAAELGISRVRVYQIRDNRRS